MPQGFIWHQKNRSRTLDQRTSFGRPGYSPSLSHRTNCVTIFLQRGHLLLKDTLLSVTDWLPQDKYSYHGVFTLLLSCQAVPTVPQHGSLVHSKLTPAHCCLEFLYQVILLHDRSSAISNCECGGQCGAARTLEMGVLSQCPCTHLDSETLHPCYPGLVPRDTEVFFWGSWSH